jgi:tRNA (guanine37-N1)-methyltransferase
MWAGVVTVLPGLFAPFLAEGVVGRAVQAGGLQIELFNPRDHADNRHRSVDDRPFGGGPGMVLQAAPLAGALAAARAAGQRTLGDRARLPVIYLSPQGSVLNQGKVRSLSREPGLILLAGRYEGVDERLLEAEIDEEVSIGDYVLTGGELPAMVLLDAVARFLPGTLGNAASALEDSHLDGLLDYPHYTRPEISGAEAVPAVLLSGDHAVVRRWRRMMALGRTWARRPEMLQGREWSAEDRALMRAWLETHGDEQAGTSASAVKRGVANDRSL